MEIKTHLLAFILLIFLVIIDARKEFVCNELADCTCVTNTTYYVAECPSGSKFIRLEINLTYDITLFATLDCKGLSTKDAKFSPLVSNVFNRIKIKDCILDDKSQFPFLSNQTALLELSLDGVRTWSDPTLPSSGPNLFLAMKTLSLPSLLHFNLEGSNLETLPVGLLRPMELVRIMSLNRNRLSVIEDDTFARQARLRYLTLNDNLITRIGLEAFAGLKSLTELSLRNNKLKDIDGMIFAHLKRLRTLDLSRNELETIDRDAFGKKDYNQTDLIALQYLDVSHNKLDYVQAKLLLEKDMIMVNDEASNLTELNLSYNRIGNITGDWPAYLKLTSLNLQHNQIQAFNISVVKLRKRGMVIDLRHNELVTVYLDDLVTMHLDNVILYGKDDFETTLKLTLGNMIDCGCAVRPFVHMMHLSRRPYSSVRLDVHDEDACNSPAGFKGRKVNSLKYTELPCECPIECKCYLNRLGNLRMECFALRETRAVSKVYHNRRIEYYQKDSRGTGFSNKTIDRFQDVIHLNLSTNNISHLANVELPACVETLDLRNNLINKVNTDFVLTMMKRPLKEVYIDGNPISCDCNNWPFMFYLQTKKFKEPLMFECMDGTTLGEQTRENLCDESEGLNQTLELIQSWAELENVTHQGSCLIGLDSAEMKSTKGKNTPMLFLVIAAILLIVKL